MENNLLEKIFLSPLVVKGGRGSPWAKATRLKGKRRMCVVLGYVRMCENNVNIGT
jgi:hypothetical protein